MINLFAYGTLMCDEIMQEVSGCQLSSQVGVLEGYSRRRVKNEHFPALLPEEGAVVEGVVYRDLSSDAWERLDRYEGEFYVLTPVLVRLEDGSVIPASTYVVQTHCMDQLAQSGWDFADFISNTKVDFLSSYRADLLL